MDLDRRIVGSNTSTGFELAEDEGDKNCSHSRFLMDYMVQLRYLYVVLGGGHSMSGCSNSWCDDVAQMAGCEQGVVLAGNRQTTDLARILDESVRLLVGRGSRIAVRSMGLAVCRNDLVDRMDTPVNCCGSYQNIAGHARVHHSGLS